MLLASNNPGKLEELRALLAGQPFSLAEPDALGLALDVVENGPDYTAIASAKAVAFARASGLWSLADDTGLEVDVLGGAPGVRSRRLAASDPERRARLLQQLAAHPRPWTASFRCAVALASPAGPVASSLGACAGEILPSARGAGGFGYDPLFLIAGTTTTMAELSLEEKNGVSHRARAVRALLPEIVARLQDA